MRFPAVLCLQGVETQEGALTRLFDQWESREVPLTLYSQLENAMGHDKAPVAGAITDVGTEAAAAACAAQGIDVEGMVAGIIDTDDEGEAGATTARLIQSGALRGISVDYSFAYDDLEVQCTAEDEDGWCIAATKHYSLAVIVAATVVGMPAFEWARVGTTPLDAVEDTADEEPVAAGARRMGTGSLVIPRDRRPLLPARPRMASLPEGGTALVASAGVDLLEPPIGWFEDPQLSEYTSSGIHDDGRVAFHIAPWDACHIGYTDRCVSPPRSACGYAHFRTGQRRVHTNNSGPHGATVSVQTGVLTVGADHAPTTGPRSGLAAAQDHYANSACGWADVAAGEDRYGIWVAGAIRPDVTDTQLVTLRGLAPSGDWRPLPQGRGREMVGVLMVNYPGFRSASPLAASASRVVQVNDQATIIVSPPAALVAAGHGEDCGCGGLDAETLAIVRALGPLAAQTLRARLVGAS